MGRKGYNKRQELYEHLQKLKRMINSGKFSEDRRIALEMQYCYIQRDLARIDVYQKLRNKNKNPNI